MKEDFPSPFVVECEIVLGVNPHVVHVDFEPLLLDVVSEDVVHEGLKHWWGIAEAEEHYGGFEQAFGGNEGRFPLVFFSDANVIVAPLDVKFGEQCGILHVVDEIRDQG